MWRTSKQLASPAVYVGVNSEKNVAEKRIDPRIKLFMLLKKAQLPDLSGRA